MAYTFWEGIADFATAGGYSMTKNSVGAALAAVVGAVAAPGQPGGGTGGPSGTGGGTQVAGQMAPGGALEGSGSASGSPGVYPSVQPQKCCCWEISGDYLLNSETGQVWLINKEQMKLLPFQKNLSLIEDAAVKVTLVAMKHTVLEQKDTEIAKMPYSLREPMTGQINTLIKAFDKEIAKK